MKHPQEFPFLRLSGGTMSGALNMGAQNITNCGNITADHANGFYLENAAASSTNPTIVPNRASVDYGMGAIAGTALYSIVGGVQIQNWQSTVTGVNKDITHSNTSDADSGGASLMQKVNAAATAALSGATVTLTNLIPAGAIVIGVSSRVTTAITGATSFDIGDGTDADRFGNDIAVSANTTTDNTSWTITSAPIYSAATSIVLTANGSNFTGGVVRVVVHYLAPGAPSS